MSYEMHTAIEKLAVRIRKLEALDVIITPARGNMYAYEVAQVVAVAASATWYEITASMSGGLTTRMTFQNNHELLILEAGQYNVQWSLGFTSGTNDEIMGTVGVNNTPVTRAANHATVQVAGRYVSAAGGTILDLAVGDVVSLFVLNESAAANITFEHATVVLSKYIKS